MITFAARSGGIFALTVGLLCYLPTASLLAQGEPPGGTPAVTAADSSAVTAAETSSAASTSSSNVVSTSSSETNNDVGVGTFTRFPLKVSVSVRGGYDDNVNNFPDGQASWFTTAGLLVSYDLATPRTSLSLATTLGFTYYNDTGSNLSNDYEPNLNLTLTLTHKATPRLSLGASVFAVYQAEPEFQYGLGTNRRAGNYFLTTDRLSATYLWSPRFSTATSYYFTAVRYDDAAAGVFEDRVENMFGNEFRFLLLPTTTAVAEYRFQVINYEHIERDSTTQFFLGGFDHVFGPRLSASFRGGIEMRDYDVFGETDSPYFETTVNYKLGKDTSVSWYTFYGIGEGDIGANSTRNSFRTGLTGKHNLTARISASASIFYYHDNYEEGETLAVTGPPVITPSFNEDTFNIDLSVRYAVNRLIGIEAGYDHTEVSSDALFRDYSRNRIWAGVNVTF